MFSQYDSIDTADILTNPRNVWTKFRLALDAAKVGDFTQADFLLDLAKYAQDVSPEVFAIYQRQIAELRKGTPPRKINLPTDYLSYKDAWLYPPIRRISANSRFPKPYPFGLSLPRIVGAQNDCGFLHDSASLLSGQVSGVIQRVHVLFTPVYSGAVATLQGSLIAQRFDGTIALTVLPPLFGDAAPLAVSHPDHKASTDPLLSAKGTALLDTICKATDLVVFLSGNIQLDPLAIERMARMARITDNLLQPVVPLDSSNGHLVTPFSFTALKKQIGNRFPFRDMRGMNFALTPTLIKRVGLPENRFDNLEMAAREMAFRVFNLGGYFSPVAVPMLEEFKDEIVSDKDRALYVSLCPNPWDRKTDSRFENPKVSVYIPTYNAGKYIERAIDSVLSQDIEDIEVCLSDDGSRDDTLALLQRHYGNEPKVRWVANANGGIGFASNQSIGLSRGLYIGQLDSDDTLKPGAVRRLAEYLDDHPEMACAYGSCERIDAQSNYIKDEYSWPVFSREKMMITSIAHHFRMFRRAAWERTSHFREDIVNAVDYDIFLKMSEVGEFHHIDEILYQRRWHGENTSNVNEGFQTSNTYRVQRETLKRLGLEQFWDVHIPNPQDPRRVTYRRYNDSKMVIYWPDYSNANPYQKLLYGAVAQQTEVCAGPIDAALQMIEEFAQPENLTFHLHWLNFLFAEIESAEEAQEVVNDFIEKLRKFKWKGGKLIWTVHNTISHDSLYHDVEIALSEQVAAIVDVLHFHSAASVDEVAESFNIPRDKVRISRHGNYCGIYPNFVTRSEARAYLNIDKEDDVILFVGQVRPYKGVEQLIRAMRAIIADRPNALLLIVGQMSFDPFKGITPALTPEERVRIRTTGRFIDSSEMQVFFNAADMAVYPYTRILTSGSLLLALSYGVPVVIPKVGMTHEVLDGRDAGVLYDGDGGADALRMALNTMLERKHAGTLGKMADQALALGKELEWPNFRSVLDIGPID